MYSLRDGISIRTEGFNCNYLDVDKAIKDLRYIIIMLANDMIPFNDLCDDIIVCRAETQAESGQSVKIGVTERISTISWKDVCDCLYDYMIENTNCKILFRADNPKIDVFELAYVHVEISFDITLGEIRVANKGRGATKASHIRQNVLANIGDKKIKFKTNFVFKSSLFYDVDIHGDNLRESGDSIDDDMEMFFNSRS
jgi:hypothetical protein